MCYWVAVSLDSIICRTKNILAWLLFNFYHFLNHPFDDQKDNFGCLSAFNKILTMRDTIYDKGMADRTEKLLI